MDHDVKEYPEAGHAFLNDHDSVRVLFAVMAKLSPGDSYHEPSAHDPRRRILSFFNTHLRA